MQPVIAVVRAPQPVAEGEEGAAAAVVWLPARPIAIAALAAVRPHPGVAAVYEAEPHKVVPSDVCTFLFRPFISSLTSLFSKLFWMHTTDAVESLALQVLTVSK